MVRAPPLDPGPAAPASFTARHQYAVRCEQCARALAGSSRVPSSTGAAHCCRRHQTEARTRAGPRAALPQDRRSPVSRRRRSAVPHWLGANLARSCVTRLNRMPLLFFSSARGTGRPAGGGSPAGRLLELQWRHHQEVKWTNSGGMCAVPPSPTGLSYLNSCRRTLPNKEMFIGLL